MTNQYPDRVFGYLRDLDAAGRALEVGSGARFVDERVASLDVVVTPGVDVVANAGALPFPDEAFGFVFAQAVLEHVPDPVASMSEMIRVLQPGGRFYAEVAFIQPVHQAPCHFFNHTRYGLALGCEGLVDIEVGPIGTFAETVRWLCVEAGAAEHLGLLWLDRLTDDLLTIHDRQSWDQRMNAASGVWLAGLKP